MTIKIVFTGENWSEIEAQLRSYRTPSAAEDPSEYKDASDDTPNDPKPTPTTFKVRRANRAKLPSIPEIIAATEPEPSEPEPAPTASKPQPATTAPEPRDLPTLDILKAAVTQAVRQAQKKEGPTKILDLLPAFKLKTGLDYVMNAEEKHREALFELLEQARSVAA